MKNLALFKNENATGNQPLYALMASVKLANGEYQSFQVGSGWVKTSKNGQKYISLKLKDVFVSENGKEYPGFRLVKETQQPQTVAPTQTQAPPQETVATEPTPTVPASTTNLVPEGTIPPIQPNQENNNEPNLADIPF